MACIVRGERSSPGSYAVPLAYALGYSLTGSTVSSLQFVQLVGEAIDVWEVHDVAGKRVEEVVGGVPVALQEEAVG